MDSAQIVLLSKKKTESFPRNTSSPTSLPSFSPELCHTTIPITRIAREKNAYLLAAGKVMGQGEECWGWGWCDRASDNLLVLLTIPIIPVT